MISKGWIAALCLTAFGFAACSGGDVPEAPAAVRVEPQSPEDRVVDTLKRDKASGLVFTIKPESKFGCRSISVNVLHKDGFQGYWEPVVTVTAEYDVNDPANRTPIDKQILYAPLLNPGTYALSDIKCVPFKGEEAETLVWRPVLGTFEAKYGKLNYVGTLVQHQLSKAVYLYTLEDYGENLKARIEGHSPELAEAFEGNMLSPNSVVNHDGRNVSIQDVLNNKDNAGDFYKLYAMLQQKADYIEDMADALNEDITTRNWDSMREVYERSGYQTRLADMFRESLYKFEDVSMKVDNFDRLEEYVFLRMQQDRAIAFAMSCADIGEFEHRNDPCFASLRSMQIAQRDMGAFLSGFSGDVFKPTDDELKVQLSRSILRIELNRAQEAYLEYVIRLNDLVSDHQVNELLMVHAPMAAAEANLRRFDARRAFARYGATEEDQTYFMELLSTAIDLRIEIGELNVRRLAGLEDQERQHLRKLKSQLNSVENYIAVLESELF